MLKQLPGKFILIFTGIILGLSLLMFFYFPLTIRGFDWLYFDSMASLIRSSILHYGVMPLHDPWACSGTSLLTNPQNWIFSPTLLITILFPPALGNIISFCILKIVGFWAALNYFSFKTENKTASILLSLLFVNLSWFSLHFTEGHIIYRSFYLLPLVFLYTDTLKNRLSWLKLTAVLAFMILDGGIYPFIFSLIYFIFAHLTSLNTLKSGVYFFKSNLLYCFSSIIGLLLLTLPKTFPVLTNAQYVRQVVDQISVPPLLVMKFLFDPFTNNTYTVVDQYRYQEFGCYLGISLFIITLLCFRNVTKKHIPHLILSFIFLWIATGWGGVFNPYSIISNLPLISKAHIQSRYFIIFALLLLSFIAMRFSGLKQRNLATALLLVANLEFLIVNFNSFANVGLAYEMPLITKETWTQTKKMVPPPHLYYEEGIVSKFCYEPSRKAPLTSAEGEVGYRGNMTLLKGSGQFGSIKLTPGKLEFDYAVSSTAEVIINTNYLEGWIEVSGNAEVFDYHSLLGMRIPAGQGRIDLQYFPGYYTWVLLAAVFGLIVMVLLYKRAG